MADVIWGSSPKPVSSRKLAESFEAAEDAEGTLYLGYPILGTPSGAFPIDATFLSPKCGLVLFDIVEGKDLAGFEDRQDEIITRMQSRLMQFPNLMDRRDLAAKVSVATFAPATANDKLNLDSLYPVLSPEMLTDFLSSLDWPKKTVFPALASAIQSLSTIRKGRRKRDVTKPDSRGAKIRKLEDSIANLDVDQGAAVIETVQGVQRIRGLAGSGKTIVLALKVAYLHAQNPDWKIAVTFNTRSLKGQFERLITNFVFEQTSEEPDWDKIEIVNAWGAPGTKDRTGIYYKFCQTNAVAYYDYRSARAKFGEDREFQGACSEALNTVSRSKKLYDAILVDEAQDFPPEFLKLCYEFLKEPKRLVYAYDEMQSLTNASMPPPEEIFGKNSEGQPLVTLNATTSGEPRQDIILERCYRNSRPILATAHSLGFGIYRPKGLVQFFDQHNLWLDVGYSIRSGKLEDDHQVSLERTDKTSPRFLEAHSPIDDLIVFKHFDTHEEQDEWLVEQIEKNIREDDLFAEDIIVINPNPLKTRGAVSNSRSMLFSKDINSSLAGVSASPDIFFESEAVTFTGIFRAKGNEAAMVYIINADDCFDAYFPAYRARGRSQLFTAITRAKAWVRVLGVGEGMKGLQQEFEQVKAKDFRLDFTYPNSEKRKQLRIINRDMTSGQKQRLVKKISELDQIINEIEDGSLTVEDLPPELQKRLKTLLSKT